eukprot:scaffold105952_cov33-Tisochrysis_lutea.AAC.3
MVDEDGMFSTLGACAECRVGEPFLSRESTLAPVGDSPLVSEDSRLVVARSSMQAGLPDELVHEGPLTAVTRRLPSPSSLASAIRALSPVVRDALDSASLTTPGPAARATWAARRERVLSREEARPTLDVSSTLYCCLSSRSWARSSRLAWRSASSSESTRDSQTAPSVAATAGGEGEGAEGAAMWVGRRDGEERERRRDGERGRREGERKRRERDIHGAIRRRRRSCLGG